LPGLGLVLDNQEVSVNVEKIETKVFPNPTTETIYFDFEKPNTSDWYVVIFNELGQIVVQETVAGTTGRTQHATQLPAQLKNGTYFYRLVDQNSLIRNEGKFLLTR
jgi:hypothetical protein